MPESRPASVLSISSDASNLSHAGKEATWENVFRGEAPVPSLEALLDLKQLDDESAVGAALQEMMPSCWRSERHLFCSARAAADLAPLSLSTAVLAHPMRFLYSFIYDSYEDLHSLVNCEYLSSCLACIQAYSEILSVFFRALAPVYDDNGVESLKQEFLLWDLRRIKDGLKCAGTAGLRPFTAALFSCFTNSSRLFKLDSNDRKSFLDDTAGADEGKPGAEVMFLRDEIRTCLNDLTAAVETNVWPQEANSVITQDDAIRDKESTTEFSSLCLPSRNKDAPQFLSSTAKVNLLRQAMSIIAAIDKGAIQLVQALDNPELRDLSSALFRVMYLHDRDLLKQTTFSSELRACFGRWVMILRGIILEDGAEFAATISKTGWAKLQQIFHAFKAALDLNLTLDTDHAPVLDNVAEVWMVLLRRGNIYRVSGEAFTTALHSCFSFADSIFSNWSPDCPVFALDCTDSTSLDVILALLKPFWTDEKLQIHALQTTKHLLFALSKFPELQGRVAEDKIRPLLTNLVDFCWQKQTNNAKQSAATGESLSGKTNLAAPSSEQARRDPTMIALRKRLVLIALSLEAFFGASSYDESVLVLRHKSNLTGILESVTKVNFLKREGADMVEIVALFFEKLADWIVETVKYEATIAQDYGVQLHRFLYFMNLPVRNPHVRVANPFNSKVPELESRATFLLPYIANFLEGFHAVPALAEQILGHRLRHMADIAFVAPMLRLFCSAPDLEVKEVDLLSKAGGAPRDEIERSWNSLRGTARNLVLILDSLRDLGLYALGVVVERTISLADALQERRSDAESRTPFLAEMITKCEVIDLDDEESTCPSKGDLTAGESAPVTKLKSFPVVIYKGPGPLTGALHPLLVESVANLRRFRTAEIRAAVEQFASVSVLRYLKSFLPIIALGDRTTYDVSGILPRALSHKEMSYDSWPSPSTAPLEKTIEFLLSLFSDNEATSVSLLESCRLPAVKDFKQEEYLFVNPEFTCLVCQKCLQWSMEDLVNIVILGCDAVFDIQEAQMRAITVNDQSDIRVLNKSGLDSGPIVAARWLEFLSSVGGEFAKCTASHNMINPALESGWRVFIAVLSEGPREDASDPFLLWSNFQFVTLEFLRIWISAAVCSLESAAGVAKDAFRHDGTLPAHVDVFTRHRKWLPNLIHWCLISQGSYVESLLANAEATGTAAAFVDTAINALNLKAVTDKWKSSPAGKQVQRITHGIARAMTVVYQNFVPNMEKGSAALPTLASGNLLKPVEDLIRTNFSHLLKHPPEKAVALEGTANVPAGERDIAKDDAKSSKSVFTPAKRITAKQQSLMDLVARLTATAGPEPVTQSIQTVSKLFSSAIKTEQLGSVKSKAALATNTPKWTRRGLSLEFKKHSWLTKKKTQPATRRFASSLLRKLGEPDIAPRVSLRKIPKTGPSLLPKPVEKSESNSSTGSSTAVSKPKALHKKIMPIRATKLASSGVSLLPPAPAPTGPRAIQFAASAGHLRGKTGTSGSELRSEQNRAPSAAEMLQPVSSEQRIVIMDRAKSQLNFLLRQILSWNMFDLEAIKIAGIQNLPPQIPKCFKNGEEFVRCFEPLVLEECRCSIVQSLGEKQLKGFPVRVTGCRREGSEVVAVLKSDCLFPEIQSRPLEQRPTRDTVIDRELSHLGINPFDLVLLVPRIALCPDGTPYTGQTVGQSAVTAVVGTSSGDDEVEGRFLGSEPPSRGYALGVIYRSDETTPTEPQGASAFASKRSLEVDMRLAPSLTGGDKHLLRRIPASRFAINSLWTAYTLASLTTSIREFQSLYLTPLSPLFSFILNPSKFLALFNSRLDRHAQTTSAHGTNSAHGINSTYGVNLTHGTNSAHGAFQLLENACHTATAIRGTDWKATTNLPQHPSQLEIMPPWLQPMLGQIRARCTLNESQISALKFALSVLPGVALLQGPPGTGKTKTLLALLAAVYAKVKAEGGRKKILVCAPSNAAVDEIASRVLKEGLPRFNCGPVASKASHLTDASAMRDRQTGTGLPTTAGLPHGAAAHPAGITVFPRAVRVGNPKRIVQPTVLKISLEEMLSEGLRKTDKESKDTFFEKRDKIKSQMDTIDAQLGQVGEHSEKDLAGRQTDLLKQKRFLHAQKQRLGSELERQLVKGRASTRDSILAQAEIVFATLSSSASELLNNIEIDCVITDEAAQAVELSSLIPLRLEAERLILIGDPQQLPATVLSKLACRYNYERSLFQRLQACGVGIKMLQVQYRMRPEISAFPASYFYRGELTNAGVVIERPVLPFHRWTYLFRPFLFFDVPGRESRDGNSLGNQIEALFVVSLVRLLIKSRFCVPGPPQSIEASPASADHFKARSPPQGNTFNRENADKLTLADIAVVTPYRQQVFEIKNLLKRCSDDFGNQELEVCTIDAFQGREKRVIIFSCVRSAGIIKSSNFAKVARVAPTRATAMEFIYTHSDAPNVPPNFDKRNEEDSDASGHLALGFVADVRRLNVAITRARDCLWIVGNAGTLMSDRTWKAFIEHAKNRSPTALIDIYDITQKLSHYMQRRDAGFDINYPAMGVENFFRLAEEYHGTNPLPSGADSRPIKRRRQSRVEDPTALVKCRKRAFSNCSSITASSGDEE